MKFTLQPPPDGPVHDYKCHNRLWNLPYNPLQTDRFMIINVTTDYEIHLTTPSRRTGSWL